MIDESSEGEGVEFMLAILAAHLEGKSAEQFADEWLNRKERERQRADTTMDYFINSGRSRNTHS